MGRRVRPPLRGGASRCDASAVCDVIVDRPPVGDHAAGARRPAHQRRVHRVLLRGGWGTVIKVVNAALASLGLLATGSVAAIMLTGALEGASAVPRGRRDRRQRVPAWHGGTAGPSRRRRRRAKGARRRARDGGSRGRAGVVVGGRHRVGRPPRAPSSPRSSSSPPPSAASSRWADGCAGGGPPTRRLVVISGVFQPRAGILGEGAG